MKAQTCITAALLLVIQIYSCVESAHYLTEKPDFLKTCKRKSADFDECFAHLLQNVYSQWKDGIPGIQGSRSLDPMHVEKFNVVEDRENVAPLAVQITNITATGLSQAKMQSASFVDKDYNFKFSYIVPKIRLDGFYTAVGQVLVLKIDTSGKMFMEIANGSYTVAVKAKLRQMDGLNFLDLKALQFRIRDIENVRFYFDNLFKDKQLTDSANAGFNDSWRSFFETFKDQIETEIKSVLLEHLQGIFNNVPANFFIEDLA